MHHLCQYLKKTATFKKQEILHNELRVTYQANKSYEDRFELGKTTSRQV